MKAVGSQQEAVGKEEKGINMRFADRVRAAIERMPDEPFTIEKLAGEMGLDKKGREALGVEMYRLNKRGDVKKIGYGLYRKGKPGEEVGSRQSRKDGISAPRRSAVSKVKTIAPAENETNADEAPVIISLSGPLAENPELREQLIKNAKNQFRSVENQIMWYVKCGIRQDKLLCGSLRAGGCELE